MQVCREICGSFTGSFAWSRPSMTRAFVSLWTLPFAGPAIILSTALFAAGSFTPASGGGRFRCELEALPRAKDGNGETTIVWSGRTLISTIVVPPHFEQ